MKYSGGPRDGQDIEPAHEGADEIWGTATDYTEDHQPLGSRDYHYVRDGFGRMVWQNPDSMQ